MCPCFTAGGETVAQPRVPGIDERIGRAAPEEIAMTGQLAVQTDFCRSADEKVSRWNRMAAHGSHLNWRHSRDANGFFAALAASIVISAA